MIKLDRTKNAFRGIVSGGFLKIFQIVLPFVIRTILIYRLGMEYLGLNSLFTSILQVLNLAELGVGTAMVFSMYRPIADGDTDKINALLKLYRTYYRVIGLVILIIGLALMPFIDKLIKSEVPNDVNIYILYAINLSATVLSYWLFAYRNSILMAYQRNDVLNIINFILLIVQYSVQITVLILFNNYYCYIVVLPIVQILINIVTAVMSKRIFPQYTPKGKLPDEDVKTINGKIKDVFTLKIGSVILNSADSIVISAFLGLRLLAVYNNYYYIMNSVIGFLTIILKSITAGLGNSFVTETTEKNYTYLNHITFAFAWLINICTVCFICIYQPFIKLWVGIDNMLSIWAVIMMGLYFYVYELNGLLNTFKDAAGIWHEDRFRPLTVALINLVLNLILVQFIGIYGIILSTVVSILFVGIPWIINNLFKYVFQQEGKKAYVAFVLRYFVVTIACGGVCYIVCNAFPDNIIGIFLRLIVCVFVSGTTFLMIFRHSGGIKYMKGLATRFFHKYNQ